MLFPDPLLQRMDLASFGQTLDGVDLRAVGLHGGDGARFRAAAVDHDGTGAALAGIASDMRACQAQLVAQEVHEQHTRVDGRFANLAVDGHRNLRHELSSWGETDRKSTRLNPVTDVSRMP